mmetsp:Transcript_27713/g.58862  ORF Transcript_27713/g.58862 Transcript_27713/m.58862 type:complete len:187 (-) Transcript_27713:148-708(-)
MDWTDDRENFEAVAFWRQCAHVLVDDIDSHFCGVEESSLEEVVMDRATIVNALDHAVYVVEVASRKEDDVPDGAEVVDVEVVGLEVVHVEIVEIAEDLDRVEVVYRTEAASRVEIVNRINVVNRASVVDRVEDPDRVNVVNMAEARTAGAANMAYRVKARIEAWECDPGIRGMDWSICNVWLPEEK